MMQKLSSGISEVIRGLSPDTAAIFKASHVHARFAEAVCREYGDKAAALVLEHVQAVYVQREDEPQAKAAKRGGGTGGAVQGRQTRIVMRVYTDDSLVRSDLDARQESLKLKMLPLGIRFDYLKVYQSTFGMRKRRPFEQTVRELRGESEPVVQWRESLDMSPQQVEDVLARVEDADLRASMERALRASCRDASQGGPYTGT